MKIIDCTFVAAGCLWWCAACGKPGASSAQNEPGSGCGNTRCDNADWPELVVALAAEGDAGSSDAGSSDAGSSDAGSSDAGSSDAGSSDIHVTAIIGGTVQEAYYGGDCPDGIDVIDCAYQFWRSPADQTITLRVAVGGGPPTTRDIPMREFNHCGNDLAYVHFQIEGSPPTAVIGEPAYVSPCRISP